MKTRRILGSLSALVFLVITTNGSNGQPDPNGIGRAYGSGDNGQQWFPGALDEVRVYDEVLDAGSISQLVSVTQGPSIQTPASITVPTMFIA